MPSSLELRATNGELTLAGTLHRPDGEARATVLMVPGSGPSDRDNDVYFPTIRAGLLVRGIAAASFDKRGVGESTGDWRDTGPAEQSADVAAQLASLGIVVEVHSFEFATFFADVKKGTYQIASMQTAEITEPDFYFMYFHSSWIPSKTNPDGFNRWRYQNPEVDRLTTLGRAVTDRAQRKQVYAEVQRLVAEDVPIVPLWHEDNIILSNVDVEGYTTSPNARLAGLTQITKLP